ncbi:MAG: hypothetical protein CVU02_01510 [Bacteroidetes bacterium HGW-Bacteroidetes-19]|nr:MAG: hypothetical protein CVU04_03055 [Bacteroidetes bacterium HGW-Bacteroidetes-20]PKP28246.1 MAG: hypothetical protein CVU02_01510 [Bacteroidetes bacterium HGW-Bacteroidetes-19]
MKNFKLFLFILCSVPMLLWAQVEQSIPSKVKKVIVYPNGAQIESEVSVPIQKGQMKITLPGLTSKINQESIRIVSDGSFTILNVQYKVDYLNQLDKNVETQKIITQMDEIKSKIEEEEVWLKIIRDKMEYLSVNKQVSGKNEAINPETFATMTQFYGSNMETLSLDALKRDRLIRIYREQLMALTAQLEKVNAHQGTPSGVIDVTIDGKQNTTGKMVFTYFVWDASWFPTYDIRFMGFNKPLEITYFANIKQTTDIDWTDVEIMLSTAKTKVSAQIPFLYPYFLGFYRPVTTTQSKMYSVDDKVSVAEGVSQDAAGNTTVRGNRSDGEITIVDGVRVRGSSNPTNNEAYTPALETIKEYIVESKQSIPSKSTITTVTYGSGTLEATYDYQTIPKLGENVYLIAKLPNWGKAELNNGVAKLYLENSYVGKSFLNTTQYKDTLDLSFGVDNNITVKREKVSEFSQKSFIGSKRKESIGYKITIRNNKSYECTTSVYDQIPISLNKEIEVDVIDINEGSLDKENGKVEWKINLKPNETKTIFIKYSVKYPKDKQVVVQ